MWTRNKSSVTIRDWSEVIGLDPWLVAGFNEPRELLFPRLGDCERPFTQTASSAGGGEYLSRDEIGLALQTAEYRIREVIRTPIAPQQWLGTLDQHRYPQFYDAVTWGNGWFNNGVGLNPIQLEFGNLLALGKYQLTELELDVVGVPDDPYSDGLDTKFSFTVTVPSGTLPSQIRVFHSNRYDLDLEAVEIQGLTVVVSNTTATVTGFMWQAVDLVYYLKQIQLGLNATDSVYSLLFDVYLQTVDASLSGELTWNNYNCDDPPCTEVHLANCFQIVDKRGGWVRPVPAIYNTDDEVFKRDYGLRVPDRYAVNYIAGIPLGTDYRVAYPWRRAVSLLATALLPQKTCGCNRADQVLAYYRDDYIEGENRLLDMELQGLAMATLGTGGRGAVEAFGIIMNDQSSRAFRSVSG